MGLLKKKKQDEKDGKTEKQAKEKTMKDLYKEEGRGEEKKENIEKDEKKTKKAPQEKSAGKRKIERSYLYNILSNPLITEKISNMGEYNHYAFKVSKDANKIEIAESFEASYGIKPRKVNIINMKGKKVRFGMHEGKRKDWKKAIITLPKDKSINIYENI